MKRSIAALVLYLLFTPLPLRADVGYWEFVQNPKPAAVRTERLTLPQTAGNAVTKVVLYGDWYNGITFEVVQLTDEEAKKLSDLAGAASLAKEPANKEIERAIAENKDEVLGIPLTKKDVGPYATRIMEWGTRQLRAGDLRREFIFAELAYTFNLIPLREGETFGGGEFRRLTRPVNSAFERALNDDKLSVVAVSVELPKKAKLDEAKGVKLGLRMTIPHVESFVDRSYPGYFAAVKKGEIRAFEGLDKLGTDAPKAFFFPRIGLNSFEGKDGKKPFENVKAHADGVLVMAQPAKVDKPGEGKAETAAISLAIEGNNALVLDLLKKQQKKAGRTDNPVIPAYSLGSALSLTLQGAKGKTLQEIVATLHLDKADKKEEALRAFLAEGYKGLGAQLGTQEKGNPFRSANGIFTDGMLLADFTKVAKESFGAVSEKINFGNDEDWKRINQFVSDNTDKKIPALLSRNPGPQSTVLVSASRFVGEWKNPFAETSTKEEKFKNAAGEENNTQLMIHRDAKFLAYAEDAGAQYVSLPYKQGYSMVVVVPKVKKDEKAGEALERVQADLTAEKYRDLVSKQLKGKQPADGVTLVLPKFELRYSSKDLKGDLKETMPLAFSPDADFSIMGGGSISDVVAEAHVRVDEKGTAAEGAAAVMLSRGISRSAYVRADHPFLYTIQKDGERDGVILFAGVVQQPAWTEKK